MTPTSPNKIMLFRAIFFVSFCAFISVNAMSAYARATVDHPIVKLRSLDKITARTQVFEARVGKTIKFGSVYIKVQACRKAPEFEQPEAAAFLQVWEVPVTSDKEKQQSEWIFSGWMFASSPGLSAMDHPIYDVWVLDCLSDTAAPADNIEIEELREGEGVLDETETPAEPTIVQ